ncbi:ribosome small subunit-dependent GTPase A [uncultured Anaerofustis sp.]|uniref:ribosome small subunit-dependent GTPase A n=1 Tax=uncultured Anaerofustis sp. TaxID=904996 RepID=UPI002601124D|nr:ribosome small subunit-dependent GTPase A [uncultured Anaerofustis sp.]
MNNNNLAKYGADERFLTLAKEYKDLKPARVISQYKGIYKIITEEGECLAKVSGKFMNEAYSSSDYPAVGDYVMTDGFRDKGETSVIHHVLDRKSVFKRTAAGSKKEMQIVASNVDIIFICMALNNDYNISRLERYMTLSWDSGAKPVIILTKSDLAENIDNILSEVTSVTFTDDIILTTNKDESSYEKINEYLKPGITGAFIGSSGVGKSTIINHLLGRDIIKTSGLRNDDKGRHTTTTRDLILLDSGGIVIDTPGMRELGTGFIETSKGFEDIEELISGCKFSDCTHTNEPGCKVREAIEKGTLDLRRYENYEKIQRENKYAGLNSKEIEKEKLNQMFKSVGGMKKARKYLKDKDKRN